MTSYTVSPAKRATLLLLTGGFAGAPLVAVVLAGLRAWRAGAGAPALLLGLLSTILLAACAVYILRLAWVRGGTILSPEGISQPGAGGRVQVRWADVERVERQGRELVVHGAGRRLRLHPHHFPDPAAVLRLVDANLPRRGGDRPGRSEG